MDEKSIEKMAKLLQTPEVTSMLRELPVDVTEAGGGGGTGCSTCCLHHGGGA